MTKRQYKHELLIAFYGNAKVRRARTQQARAGNSVAPQQKEQQQDAARADYFVNDKGKLQNVVAEIKKQLIIVANVLLDSVTELEQG